MPTIAEAGLPGYESHSWYGFAVAAKTPQPVVDRLNREIVQALNRPDSVDVLLKQGQEVWTTTPEEFARYIRSEHAKWGRLIRETGMAKR